MSLYCGTLDVRILAQVNYDQYGTDSSNLTFADNPTFNSWIQGTLIPNAMKFLDGWCGANFLSNSGTIVVDGSGKETQLFTKAALVNGVPADLLPLPLITVTAVSIDGVAQTIGGFQIYPRFLTYEDDRFDKGRQNIQIVGTWGYTTVPEDIRHVTAQLCANVLTEMLRVQRIPDLITPIVEGGGSLGVLFRSPRVLTKNEKDLLRRYRQLEVDFG